ncbi:MAG: hypothetical protein FJ319_02375 [SAR202 cluster bacterium]|nr:hypothetical protein [SAR202 cluster bacterium]
MAMGYPPRKRRERHEYEETETVVRDDVDTEARTVVTERTVPASEVDHERAYERAPWSPAKLVALAIGIGLTVFGLLSFIGSGFQSFTDHITVAGIHHTPMMGAIEFVFGLLMIMAGAMPGASRGLMTMFGAVSLAWGMVVMVRGDAFHESLGMHPEYGWAYFLLGGV